MDVAALDSDYVCEGCNDVTPLNGAQLLEEALLPDGRTLVLVKWGDEYVTGRVTRLTDHEWSGGRYFTNREAAYAAFIESVQHEYAV